MPLVPRNLNPNNRLACNSAVLPFDFQCRPQPSQCQAPLFTAGFAGSKAWKTAIKFGPAKLVLPGLWMLLTLALTASADGVRVRDLVMVAGARDNQLVGYGLVAGLNGDGDKDPVYTKQTIANLLLRYGINVPATTLSAKNVAVVMVTADIPAFAKLGGRIFVIPIRVVMKRDGTVVSAEVVEKHDRLYRDIAISARNAVLLSSPILMPPGDFPATMHFTIILDPRDTQH